MQTQMHIQMPTDANADADEATDADTDSDVNTPSWDYVVPFWGYVVSKLLAPGSRLGVLRAILDPIWGVFGTHFP